MRDRRTGLLRGTGRRRGHFHRSGRAGGQEYKQGEEEMHSFHHHFVVTTEVVTALCELKMLTIKVVTTINQILLDTFHNLDPIHRHVI